MSKHTADCEASDFSFCSGQCMRAPDRVRELEEQLVAAERRCANARAAAVSAAQTSVTAIERLQEMEKVVAAAEDWAHGGHPEATALADAVLHWQKIKRKWS